MQLSPKRLFVALLPDRTVQSAIQRHARSWQWPEHAKPTRFGRYHLTLHFLGDEVRLAKENALRKALREISMQPMELVLATTRIWGQGRAVLLPDPHEALAALQRETAAAAQQPDSPFNPHIVLARDAADAVPPARPAPIRWPVREFLLLESLLPPQAKPARYEIVERFTVETLEAPTALSGQPGDQFPLFG